MTDLPGPALLFCPADRPERFAKAAAAADGVILDLEDAVAPEHKDAARGHVVAALDRWPAAVVRVNAAGSAGHDADLAALDAHPDAVVMLPKAARRADVEALAPRPVVALCETAQGVLAAADLARAGNCVALMWGGEDLLADLGGRPGRGRSGGLAPVLESARWAVLLAARAAGLPAVDTPYVDLADLATLRRDADDAAAAGFAAKACVHPRQVATVRAAFAPTPDELAWASEVLDAAREGGAVFRFRGRMVDAPVLAHARGLLAAAARAAHQTR